MERRHLVLLALLACSSAFAGAVDLSLTAATPSEIAVGIETSTGGAEARAGGTGAGSVKVEVEVPKPVYKILPYDKHPEPFFIDECTDVPPDGCFSCLQQKHYGKCDTNFMLEGNYCAATCSRYPCHTVIIKKHAYEKKALAALESSGPSRSSATAYTVGGSAASASSSASASSTSSTYAEVTTVKHHETVVVSHDGKSVGVDCEAHAEGCEYVPAVHGKKKSHTTCPVLHPAEHARKCHTVLDLVERNKLLSILGLAVKAAGLEAVLGDPALKGTVFAPTNAAFVKLAAKLGLEVAELLEVPDLLTSVLAAHIVPGQPLPAASIPDGAVLPTLLEGEVLTASRPSEDSLVIIPTGGKPSSVVIADILACKAIVHVVDTVLVPGSLLS